MSSTLMPKISGSQLSPLYYQQIKEETPTPTPTLTSSADEGRMADIDEEIVEVRTPNPNDLLRSAFNQMLLTRFGVKEIDKLPFNKLDYAFEIINGKENFTFSDADERLDNFLTLMACLHCVSKEEPVCFISPTHHYALQAEKLFILPTLKRWKCERNCYVVIPGMGAFKSTVNASKVLFMHGKDFSEYLPHGWTGRKIIQIFPGENVRVDPIYHNPYCCDPCN